MCKKFIRFQGTKNLETNSVYNMDLYSIYRDKVNNLHKTKRLDFLVDKYKHTLNLRPGITPINLVKEVIKCSNENELYELSAKYPTNGIFAYDFDFYTEKDDISLRDMIVLPGFYEIAKNPKYLTVYEGKIIKKFNQDEPDGSGEVLIKPTKILESKTMEIFEELKKYILEADGIVKKYKGYSCIEKEELDFDYIKDDNDILEVNESLIDTLNDILNIVYSIKEETSKDFEILDIWVW